MVIRSCPCVCVTSQKVQNGCTWNFATLWGWRCCWKQLLCFIYIYNHTKLQLNLLSGSMAQHFSEALLTTYRTACCPLFHTAQSSCIPPLSNLYFVASAINCRALTFTDNASTNNHAHVMQFGSVRHAIALLAQWHDAAEWTTGRHDEQFQSVRWSLGCGDNNRWLHFIQNEHSKR